jgi:iron complex outermembrane receptor protein
VESLTVTTERKSTQEASEVTPYVNVAYHWTDDLMAYLSYSKGFKSGGFTQRVFPPVAQVPDVDPEFVTVYEAGFKWSAAGHRARINGAVFYTDYSDIQVQGFTAAGGVAPVYINGPKARMQGFELEVQASPAEGWFTEMSVGYLDDKYLTLPPTVIGIDLAKDFERVSKWTLAAAVQKDFELGAGGGRVRPRLDWAYRSKFYNDSSNLEPIAQPGYSVLNGSVTWLSAEEQWSVAAGVSNLSDKDYITTSVYNPTLRDYSVVPARGREWYLTVRAKF